VEIIPSQKPEPEIDSPDKLRTPLVNPITKYDITREAVSGCFFRFM
jgi:hypothetical protein